MIISRADIFSNCVEKIKVIFPIYVLQHYDAQVCVTMEYFSMIGQFLFTKRNKNKEHHFWAYVQNYDDNDDDTMYLLSAL